MQNYTLALHGCILDKVLYKAIVIGLKFRTIFDQAGYRPNSIVWVSDTSVNE
ncbi:hypothetical protein H2O73_18120 [Vibrio sp. 404]|uniref:Uncharacterized protein n=1 Tax=Vibrio marinisediminis TaxID=2758441 RepID=A0A7W2FU30_9VIBR|nr:hypothetical protein [Vibrio marinisediminis]